MIFFPAITWSKRSTSTSSSPEARIATRGARTTASDCRPIDAAIPISAARMREAADREAKTVREAAEEIRSSAEEEVAA